MNIILAILVQAPIVPEPVRLPESNIVIERFMLKGDEPDMSSVKKTENVNLYF